MTFFSVNVFIALATVLRDKSVLLTIVSIVTHGSFLISSNTILSDSVNTIPSFKVPFKVPFIVPFIVPSSTLL